MKVHFAILGYLFFIGYGCTQAQAPKTEILPAPGTFNEYWYAGLAELNSYSLEQARYGELRKGEAVMVFVTEPFSKEKQVKADNPGPTDYNVMKLNMEKKFLTGIYPYSMLTSSFVPVDDTRAHATKVTASVQEWCGHVFSQLNNRDGKYQVEARSYFEADGDRNFELPITWLEDELWAKIRLNPDLLPTGELEIIPAFFYLRLLHKDVKNYKAVASKQQLEGGITAYRLMYPELNRELTIRFGTNFPYTIEGWEETYVDGWNAAAQKLTTKATKIKTLRLDYWTKNGNEDLPLRKALGLER
ncbi:MAG: hypothetical protein JNJ57_10280 [Saprospiraceae bacterium]|nr:hypothetical protein [Saprospiraceae bacterium]